MKDVEERIRRAVATTDLDHLDHNIEAMIGAAEIERRAGGARRALPLLLAAACFASALLGAAFVAFVGDPPPAAQPKIILIESSPELEAWLTKQTRGRRGTSVDERWYRSVEATYLAGSENSEDKDPGSQL